MKIADAVAGRIIESCRERSITLNKLCTLSAVTQSTVSDIVNGRTNIPGKKLCDGLDILIKEFFDTPVFAALEQEIQ